MSTSNLKTNLPPSLPRYPLTGSILKLGGKQQCSLREYYVRGICHVFITAILEITFGYADLYREYLSVLILEASYVLT